MSPLGEMLGSAEMTKDRTSLGQKLTNVTFVDKVGTEEILPKLSDPGYEKVKTLLQKTIEKDGEKLKGVIRLLIFERDLKIKSGKGDQINEDCQTILTNMLEDLNISGYTPKKQLLTEMCLYSSLIETDYQSPRIMIPIPNLNPDPDLDTFLCIKSSGDAIYTFKKQKGEVNLENILNTLNGKENVNESGEELDINFERSKSLIDYFLDSDENGELTWVDKSYKLSKSLYALRRPEVEKLIENIKSEERKKAQERARKFSSKRDFRIPINQG